MTMTSKRVVPGGALTPRLEAIYRQHHAFVWSSLLRLGVASRNLEDACQDVFVVVFRRLDDFEARSRLRTWLFAIARRVAYRSRRGAARAERKAQALALQPTWSSSLEETLENRDEAALVLHALDGLDDEKRSAVVLHVFEGMTGPEIARTLGLPVETAYSRIKAGRRQLRSRLQESGVFDGSQVYDAARRQTQPGTESRDRVAALLALRLAPVPIASVALGKGLAAAVAAGLLGWVGARALEHEPPSGAAVEASIGSAPAADRPSTPPNPSKTLSSSLDPAPAVIAAQVPVVAPSSPRRHVEPAPSDVDTPDRLLAEVRLIGAVKSALDGDRTADAMRTLDEHARRFPDGKLAQERRGYRAIALCNLGRHTEGRGAAQAFTLSHGNATLVQRVRATCRLATK